MLCHSQLIGILYVVLYVIHTPVNISFLPSLGLQIENGTNCISLFTGGLIYTFDTYLFIIEAG